MTGQPLSDSQPDFIMITVSEAVPIISQLKGLIISNDFITQSKTVKENHFSVQAA